MKNFLLIALLCNCLVILASDQPEKEPAPPMVSPKHGGTTVVVANRQPLLVAPLNLAAMRRGSLPSVNAAPSSTRSVTDKISGRDAPTSTTSYMHDTTAVSTDAFRTPADSPMVTPHQPPRNLAQGGIPAISTSTTNTPNVATRRLGIPSAAGTKARSTGDLTAADVLVSSEEGTPVGSPPPSSPPLLQRGLAAPKAVVPPIQLPTGTGTVVGKSSKKGYPGSGSNSPRSTNSHASAASGETACAYQGLPKAGAKIPEAPTRPPHLRLATGANMPPPPLSDKEGSPATNGQRHKRGKSIFHSSSALVRLPGAADEDPGPKRRCCLSRCIISLCYCLTCRWCCWCCGRCVPENHYESAVAPQTPKNTTPNRPPAHLHSGSNNSVNSNSRSPVLAAHLRSNDSDDPDNPNYDTNYLKSEGAHDDHKEDQS